MIVTCKNVILVDLDHTLFDASWRDHLIPAAMETNEWDAYHGAGIKDKLCQDVADLIWAFHRRGHEIFAITARPDKWRRQTKSQFQIHGMHIDELLMRPQIDWSPSPELKLALARERFGANMAEKILFIIDDRADVCEAFAAVGISSLQIRGRKYD